LGGIQPAISSTRTSPSCSTGPFDPLCCTYWGSLGRARQGAQRLKSGVPRQGGSSYPLSMLFIGLKTRCILQGLPTGLPAALPLPSPPPQSCGPPYADPRSQTYKASEASRSLHLLLLLSGMLSTLLSTLRISLCVGCPTSYSQDTLGLFL
jgi:hypothetical protein